jgi:hypothetical protein
VAQGDIITSKYVYKSVRPTLNIIAVSFGFLLACIMSKVLMSIYNYSLLHAIEDSTERTFDFVKCKTFQHSVKKRRPERSFTFDVEIPMARTTQRNVSWFKPRDKRERTR